MTVSTPFPHWQSGPSWLAVSSLLNDFAAIGLADLEAAALMDRHEYKFTFAVDRLPELLLALGGDYQILTVGGQAVQGYLSRYYDTAEFGAYRAQHTGRARRHKVRWRKYHSTGASFLEIKRRERGGTRKVRVAAPTPQPTRQADFLAEHAIDAALLRPVLDVECSRITLVRTHPTPERLTLDLMLRLVCTTTGMAQEFSGVVIAELKCPGTLHAAHFAGVARRLGLRSGGMSKFGVGCALHYPQLKHNMLLPQLRQLRQLQGQTGIA